MTGLLEYFISALIASLPMVVIAVVGLVLCSGRLTQAHAKARRFAMLGFGLLALHALSGAFLRTFVAMATVAARQGNPIVSMDFISLAGIALNLLLAASIVLLLCAVLADRSSSESARGAT